MTKSKIYGLAFLLASLMAPALYGEPISYQLLFPASGTFQSSTTGEQTVFNTNVVITMRNETTRVRVEGDGDGDPIGWQTVAPLVTITIPGVVQATGSPETILAPTGSGLEIYGDVTSYLPATLVLTLQSGSYNLVSNVSSPASITVNYFNQGVFATNKGIVTFNPSTVSGYFTGTVVQTSTTEK